MSTSSVKNLLQAIAEDNEKKLDFSNSFKQILDFVMKLKEQNRQWVDSLKEMIDNTLVGQKEENKKNISKALVEFEKKFSKLTDEEVNFINWAKEKIDKIKNGADGLPGENGYTPVKGVDYFDGKDGLEITPEQIADKLESIESEDDKLKISAVSHLREELDALKKMRTQSLGGGGGFSKNAMEFHFIDDETPTNSGDNLNFTIAHLPSPTSSLKVYRNGQRLRITEDYTFSGQTITLLTALSAGEIILVDYRT